MAVPVVMAVSVVGGGGGVAELAEWCEGSASGLPKSGAAKKRGSSGGIRGQGFRGRRQGSRGRAGVAVWQRYGVPSGAEGRRAPDHGMDVGVAGGAVWCSGGAGSAAVRTR